MNSGVHTLGVYTTADYYIIIRTDIIWIRNKLKTYDETYKFCIFVISSFNMSMQ